MSCMTYQDKLRRFSELLDSLPVAVHHYWRPRLNPPFMVWQEEGENALSCNNRPGEHTATGTLDYFTPTEFDPVADEIPRTLRAGGASCALISVQYEESTHLIHYEWSWEV